MGYLNDTDMSQLIPPNAITKTAGTWAESVAASIYASIRTAEATSF